MCYLPRIKLFKLRGIRSPLDRILSKRRSYFSPSVKNENESSSEILGSSKIGQEQLAIGEEEEENRATSNPTVEKTAGNNPSINPSQTDKNPSNMKEAVLNNGKNEVACSK